MKTIIHVVQHMQPGGIETMVLELARYAHKKYRTIIISLQGDHSSAINDWPRLTGHQADLIFLNKPDGWSIKHIFRLKHLLRSIRPVAVHTHHIGPMIYGGIAARLAGINRVVHTEHDAWHLQSVKRRILHTLATRLVRPAMIADAEFVQKSLCQYFPGLDVDVIPNGIDSEYFIPGEKGVARQQLCLPQDVILLGTAGRLEPVKAQDRLIRSLVKLPEHIHLAIAGDGSLGAILRQLVEKLHLQMRVHFTGRLDDMRLFYQSLDVFCLPSHKEGMPLSVLEAQACGIPAVITDVGGSCETLCQQTGVLMADNEVATLVDAMKTRIESLQAVGVSPREHVMKHGDVRRAISMYINHYEGEGKRA